MKRKMEKIVDKYTYCIEWFKENNSHMARCLEFPSLAAHGEIISKALREIEKVIEASVEWMMEEGEQIPEPLGEKTFKGHISLRIPPELHRSLAMQAAGQGISINRLISSRLRV